MPTLMLKLPDLETDLENRPEECPYCGGKFIQKWGRTSRNVFDIQNQVTEIQRYRCGGCGGTFREYPPGIPRSGQSNRIKQLAAIAWAIGMSLREVVAIFEEFGIELSHTTVWREGQKFVKLIESQASQKPLQRYAIDRNFVPKISNRFGVVLAADFGRSKPLVLGTINEHDPRLVKKWLEPLLKDSNIEINILGTDLFLSRAFGINSEATQPAIQSP